MTGASVRSRDFGELTDGRRVREYTLDNGAGLSLRAINLGGIVTALRVPDRQGVAGNIVLGFDTLAPYEAPHPHFGTIVGRHANRICNGRFRLGAQVHQLALNDGPHALHGGPAGFGKQWWHITELPVADDGSVAIALEHVSEDGAQGYPGQLHVQVRYTLTPRNAWRIDYRASCDRSTIVSLTHHDYFNLAGTGDILAHRLTLAASHYCPVDVGLIPEGVSTVAGTPFDFREPTPIGSRIRLPDSQLVRARGYDHNWVLDGQNDGALHFAARLEDPVSGRAMDIETTKPGIQFYSGNFLDGSLVGADGRVIRQSDGLCLETQQFPDAPNHPEFPSTVLQPGDVYTSSTVHRFGLCVD